MPFELTVEPLTLLILALVAFVAGFIDAIAGGGGCSPPRPCSPPACRPIWCWAPTNSAPPSARPPPASPTTDASCSTPRSGAGRWSVPWSARCWGTGRPLHAGRLAEQDAASDRLRLWRLPVVRRDAQGTVGCRRADQEEVAVPQGFGLGFYDGVAGPGTGAFWTVSTLLLYPIDRCVPAAWRAA